MLEIEMYFFYYHGATKTTMSQMRHEHILRMAIKNVFYFREKSMERHEMIFPWSGCSKTSDELF
jgi:hypothetical protein